MKPLFSNDGDSNLTFVLHQKKEKAHDIKPVAQYFFN